MSSFTSRRKASEILVVAGLAIALAVAPAAASGLVECDTTDASKWQEKTVLEKRLTGEGWSVRKIEVDENCYEVYGTTPEGAKVEAFFNPVSLEKLLVSRRGEILYRNDDAIGAMSK